MAKAKFPGKPPKTSQITRLRVSSHCVQSCNDPSRSAAQQAIIGLRLFNQHFSPDDEVFKTHNKTYTLHLATPALLAVGPPSLS